jgi:hypothetical protein
MGFFLDEPKKKAPTAPRTRRTVKSIICDPLREKWTFYSYPSSSIRSCGSSSSALGTQALPQFIIFPGFETRQHRSDYLLTAVPLNFNPVQRTISLDRICRFDVVHQLAQSTPSMAAKGVRGLSEAMKGLSLASQTCREAASVRQHQTHNPSHHRWM